MSAAETTTEANATIVCASRTLHGVALLGETQELQELAPVDGVPIEGAVEPPSRSRTSAQSLTGSSPSTEIEPESGVRSPAMLSTVVVLPAPLGPDDAEDLPLLNGEGDVIDGNVVPVTLVQISHFQSGHTAKLGAHRTLPHRPKRPRQTASPLGILQGRRSRDTHQNPY